MFLFSYEYAAEVSSFQSLKVKFTAQQGRVHILDAPHGDIILIYRFTPHAQENLVRCAKNLLMMSVPFATEGLHNNNFNATHNDPHLFIDCGQGRNDIMIKNDSIIFFAPEMIYNELRTIPQGTKTFVTFSQLFPHDVAKILFASVPPVVVATQESPILTRVKSFLNIK